MSQTGTPTEFLQLGITEPDDTLNVLVDLNGQWQKIDTGVKNVDTKANTNASGISALNTAVQDNTENITNILETNVNQQNSIDTLQSKVATLEQDDTDYGTRITAVEAGVQENSELINDLEVDLSGVKTDMGTVPSGSTLQGQVDGLDTRVTTLENSGSVSALETRVTTLETEVGSVPSGETVQGQITTLNGQVNSGNIPFRFSVDGGGNYGYLKADDSFVPFSSSSPTNLNGYNIIEIPGYSNITMSHYQSCFIKCNVTDTGSPYYNKIVYIPTMELFEMPSGLVFPSSKYLLGEVMLIDSTYYYFNRSTHTLTALPTSYAVCSDNNSITYYTKESSNNFTLHYIDLIDSNNNTTLVISFPNDKLQSSNTGRKGMIFSSFYGGIDQKLIYYLTNNDLIEVTYSGVNGFQYNVETNKTISNNTSGLYYDSMLNMTSSGITLNDTILCLHEYGYIKLGKYVVEVYRRHV